jgi:hypothetical protein
MLEQRELLMRPRQSSTAQPIVDAESGAPLGYAQWRAASDRPWWRRFGGSLLAVHEHEDEPLLFTIRRCWGLRVRHEVRDADGHRVGSLVGRAVHDRHGRTVAVRQPEPGGAVFRGPDQRELARLTSGIDGLRLSFGDEVFLNPFAKMLLLAAALSAEEEIDHGPLPARLSRG